MTDTYENLSVPNIRLRIERAIESAPLHTVKDADQGNTDQQLSYHENLADLPDEEIFNVMHLDEDPSIVHVTDPGQFITLLKHTYDILAPSLPIDVIEKEAVNSTMHEYRHAQEAVRINPDAGIRFNVRVIKANIDGEINVAVSAFASIEGKFRKIDLARIAAAPRGDLSPSDIAQLKSYGFESVEELDQRVRALEEQKLKKIGDIAAA
jgi:hypothetical protein